MLRSHELAFRSLRPWRRHATSKPSPSSTEKQWASTATADGKKDGTAKARNRRSSKVEDDATADGRQDAPPKTKRGRPRKTPAIASEPDADTSTSTTQPEAASLSTSRRRRASTQSHPDLPPRLTALASEHHHNLATFARYAQRKKLSPTSNVYKGAHYEYTCMRTLSSPRYNFQLHRTGRANDLGIDLLGWWKLPVCSSAAPVGDAGGKTDDGDPTGGEAKRKRRAWRRLQVLAQCKALAPKPAMMRELEGAYVGAPAGWSSSPAPDGTADASSPAPTLALLISTGAATKGVLAALRRSRWPMGLLQMTREGEVKQFLWNAVAAESCGLEGLGVVVRYSERKGKGTGEGEIRQSVGLTWMGRAWRA